jgi:CelD/BcsL family acetyltransferase involved in cellulose biosynthesis
VFQLSQWAVPWARVFVPSSRLAVVVLADAGGLCGVLPLAAAADSRRLRFLGTPLNDRNGMLADPHHLESTWKAALSQLAKRQWQELAFGEAPDADRRACLRMAGRTGVELAPEPSPVVPLPASWPEYEQSLSPSFRNRVRRAARQMSRMHDLSFELLEGEAVIPSALISFHQRRINQWRESGRLRLLTPFERSEGFASFLVAAGTSLARAGHLAISNLLIDGDPVASCLYLLARDTALDYMGTYERRLARLCPGQLCTLFGIRHLMDRGVRTYDFGRGDEAYKFRFRAVRRDLGGVRVTWN